jgi:hypothetical protein
MMRYNAIAVIVLSLLMFSCASTPPNKNVKSFDPLRYISVRGVGKGSTTEDALKSAFFDAVSKAVGMIVDVSQSLDNDLFSEKINVLSSGVIESYKLTHQSESNGLVSVEIDALVKRIQLINTSKSTGLTLKNSVEGEWLFAQAVTQNKVSDAFTNILNSIINGDYVERKVEITKPLELIPIEKLTEHHAKLSGGSQDTAWVSFEFEIVYDYTNVQNVQKKFIDELFLKLDGKLITKKFKLPSTNIFAVKNTSFNLMDMIRYTGSIYDNGFLLKSSGVFAGDEKIKPVGSVILYIQHYFHDYTLYALYPLGRHSKNVDFPELGSDGLLGVHYLQDNRQHSFFYRVPGYFKNSVNLDKNAYDSRHYSPEQRLEPIIEYSEKLLFSGRDAGNNILFSLPFWNVSHPNINWMRGVPKMNYLYDKWDGIPYLPTKKRVYVEFLLPVKLIASVSAFEYRIANSR